MPMRISAKMRISLVKVPSSDGFLRSLSLKTRIILLHKFRKQSKERLVKILEHRAALVGNEILACHVLYLVILSGY